MATTSVVLITTSSSPQTWTVPANAPAGTVLTIEAWGAGSGGAGKGASVNGQGGAGGAYAKSLYTVTPTDVASGISFTLKAGGTGTTNANSAAGADTIWSANNKNLVLNSIFANAALGPGGVATNWHFFDGGTGISSSVTAIGLDPTLSIPMWQLRVFGTPTGTGTLQPFFCDAITVSTATTYTPSVYLAYLNTGTNLTNTANHTLYYYDTVSFAHLGSTTITPNTLLTRYTATGASSTSTSVAMSYVFDLTSGQAVDYTFRVCGPQFELGSSATSWASTIGYTVAKGGGATVGTGSTGGQASASTFTIFGQNGGGGASQASLAGGGGAAGASGDGTTATTATGGTGDGGTVAAGVSNVEGGGGGTAVATAGGTGGAAGAPGGGGGGETGSSGSRTGGAGGRGQVRITYTPTYYGQRAKPTDQRYMLIR